MIVRWRRFAWVLISILVASAAGYAASRLSTSAPRAAPSRYDAARRPSTGLEATSKTVDIPGLWGVEAERDQDVIASGDASFWVIVHNGVERRNPVTAGAIADIPVTGATDLAFGDGELWVLSYGIGFLVTT